MSNVRDFRADLTASREALHHPRVKNAIRRSFRGALAVHEAHHRNDLLGADFWVEVAGEMIPVDLKVRAKDFAAQIGREDIDVVLELGDNGAPGWSTAKSIAKFDLIVALDTGRFACFKHDELREVALRWGASFITDPRCKPFSTKSTCVVKPDDPSRIRTARAVAVPASLIKRAIEFIRAERVAKGGGDAA